MLTNLVPVGSGEVLVVGNDPECGVASEGSATAEVGDPNVGNWTKVETMSSARTGPVVVGLADGSALVTGGATPESDGAVAKSSTLVFDPARRAWSRSGLLHTARMAPAAARLRDGRVLVVGGLYVDGANGGRALDSAEIWDPATGIWTTARPMSVPRLAPQATTLLDGRVLAVGGYSSWGADDPVASAEIYDPARDSWSPAGALRAPREGFSLVALQGGGALVLGGRQRRAEPDAAGAIFEAASTPETFEPAGNTWRRLENAQLRGGAPVQLPDGRVFVLDGRTVRLLDPLTGIVRSGAPLPTERGDAQAILLADGSVLVGGGWSQAANPGDTPSCASPDPRVWRYFPGS